jgi:hypothetical protein
VLVGRRVDLAVVIGAALEAKVAGVSRRCISARLGVPEGTVRSWFRRFAMLAAGLTQRVLAVAADADPAVRAPPPGPPVAVAVAAVGVAGAAMASLSGEPVDPWRFAVRVTAGELLAAPTRSAPR